MELIGGLSKEEIMTYIPPIENKISTLNSVVLPSLSASEVSPGTGEIVSEYGRAGISIWTPFGESTSGTLTIEVSRDGVNYGGPNRTFVDTAVAQPHMWNIVEKYFRLTYTNGITSASALEIQTQYSNNVDIFLGHQLDETLLDETEAIVARSVLVGKTPLGKYVNVPVDNQGRLDIDVPFTAFGELSVAENTPHVQVKFSQGLNTDIVQTLTNKSGSSVSASGGLCTVTVASAAEAFSQIRSIDFVRYGAGQGMRARFTACFSEGLADSTLWVGPGDEDEMLGVGYNGTAFGLLHRCAGELEVRRITFTAGGDGGGGTFTLTLDGTPITITVGAGDSIADVCALVVAASDDVFNAGRGWELYTADSKSVTFISLVAENATGTFSFADVDSGVTAGTFEQATTLLEGVAPTEIIVPQTEWNVDVCDGTGSTSNPSSMLLDPTKINVFDMAIQYLGAGDFTVSIESSETGKFTPVHVFKNAGTRIIPTFVNPTFHLNAIAKTNTGFSGASQFIKTASMGGFIEGKETIKGVRHSTSTVVAATTTKSANLTLHNKSIFNGTRNKVVTYPDYVSIINEATRPITVELILNPTHIDSGVTLSAVDSGTSVMEVGQGCGTVQGGTSVIKLVVPVSDSKAISVGDFDLHLRPTDIWVFVVQRTTGGANGDVTIAASWLDRI